MSLTEYNKKRNFKNTPEPKSTVNDKKGKLIFVVQKHQASQLHYDFRLESGGVLKSWAVPKGPSMNPSEKRLAIMVEDHPVEYAKFKGEIPEGNYGAGTVEIWDSGVWVPQPENVEKALKEGVLEFVLGGDKLKGEFVLVKMETSDTPNSWLLIKKDDEFAIHKEYDANKISTKK